MPRIFIASSTEDLFIAEKFSTEIRNANIGTPILWTDLMANGTGRVPLHILIEETEKSDFAIFIINCNDKSEIRGEDILTPRDNVIFEFGMFISKLKPENCFFIRNSSCKAHVLSDYKGFIHLTFEQNNGPNIQILNSINIIRHHIRNNYQLNLEIIEKLTWEKIISGSKEIWTKMVRDSFIPELVICTPDASAIDRKSVV